MSLVKHITIGGENADIVDSRIPESTSSDQDKLLQIDSTGAFKLVANAPSVVGISYDAGSNNLTLGTQTGSPTIKLATLDPGSSVTPTQINTAMTALVASQATQADLEKLHGVTASATEINALAGSGVVKADLEKLHGVTATAAEINTLTESGITKADLEKLHGVTATKDDLNILTGATGKVTSADLEKLGDITATADEINILHGVTTTGTTAIAAANINTLAGINTTETIQSQLDKKINKPSSPSAGNILKYDSTSSSWIAGSIDASGIGSSAITADKLADDAVTSAKIATGAVGADALDSSIISGTPSSTNKIATATVTGTPDSGKTLQSEIDDVEASITTLKGDASTTGSVANTATTITTAAINALDKENTNDSALKTVDKITQADGVVTATFKDISEMTAATSSTAGVKGLVPASAAGEQNKLLTAGKTWVAVVDDLTTASSTQPLSAAQGKALSERVASLEALGKYLALWDCTTGKPTTEPSSKPYAYSTGCYYRVSKVGTTNYKPNGTEYTGAASTTVESGTVNVGDLYLYDGSTWSLQQVKDPSAITDVKIQTGTGTATTVVSSGVATIKADGSTVEFNTDGKLQVKDSGVAYSKIKSDDIQTDAVPFADPTTGKLASVESVSKAFNAFPDGSTLEQNTTSKKLQVKDGGLTVGKLSATAVSTSIPATGGVDTKVTTEKAVVDAISAIPEFNPGATTPVMKGLVPIATSGDSGKYLKGDGTWADIPADALIMTATVNLAAGTFTVDKTPTEVLAARAANIPVLLYVDTGSAHGTILAEVTQIFTVNDATAGTTKGDFSTNIVTLDGQFVIEGNAGTTAYTGVLYHRPNQKSINVQDETGLEYTEKDPYEYDILKGVAFTGATSSANGKMGMVPAPETADVNKFLKADGNWATPADTHYESSTIVGASATATANAAATDGNVFLNHIENSTVKSAHNIVGSGATKVTSDASGKITVASTDTTYEAVSSTKAGLAPVIPASAAGKVLTVATGGTSAEWTTIDALPSQSGEAGKYLTTNGTTASWATLTLPSDMTGASASAAGTHGLVPAPAAGKQNSFLRGDGQWADVASIEIARASTTATASTAVAIPTSLGLTNANALAVYQSGLLLTPTTHYTVAADLSKITLTYTATAGDIFEFVARIDAGVGTYLKSTDITTGATNGTIKVGSTDIAVKGLGSAAYAAATDFAAASTLDNKQDKLAVTGTASTPVYVSAAGTVSACTSSVISYPLATSTGTMAWNTEYRLGSISALTATMPTPSADCSSEVRFTFTASAAFTPAVTCSGYTVLGTGDVSIASGKTYEMSYAVLSGDKIGVACKEWA